MRKKLGAKAIAGKDIDHKRRNAGSSKMDNSTSNLRVVSKKRNRARNGGKGGRRKGS